jgi:hypothetical protein
LPGGGCKKLQPNDSARGRRLSAWSQSSLGLDRFIAAQSVNPITS